MEYSDKEFRYAVNYAKSMDLSIYSNDQKLKLYSLYKQASEGDADPNKVPSKFNFVERAKYDGWGSLTGMPKNEASKKYIDYLKEINPSFSLPEFLSDNPSDKAGAQTPLSSSSLTLPTGQVVTTTVTRAPVNILDHVEKDDAISTFHYGRNLHGFEKDVVKPGLGFSLSIAFFGLVSGAGIGGFMVTVYPVQALAGLGAFATGVLGMGFVFARHVSKYGLISFFSKETQSILLGTTLLDVVENIINTTAIRDAILSGVELVPLALAETQEERIQAISNLSKPLRAKLTTTGILNFLPDGLQRTLLPSKLYQERHAAMVLHKTVIKSEEEERELHRRRMEQTRLLLARRAQRTEEYLSQYVVVQDMMAMSKVSGKMYWRVRGVVTSEWTSLIAPAIWVAIAWAIFMSYFFSSSSSSKELPAATTEVLMETCSKLLPHQQQQLQNEGHDDWFTLSSVITALWAITAVGALAIFVQNISQKIENIHRNDGTRRRSSSAVETLVKNE